KGLPEDPGVYLMKDGEGAIIYIGKAKVLKNRVRSYFRSLKGQAPKVAAMVQKVRDIDYIIVGTEMEALVLESNLIKANKPFYNILLKDDKQYPYVRLDLNDPFPRIEVVRKVVNDGAKYYGPYHNATILRDVLDAVGQNFKLRTCKRDIKRSLERGERPCLNYQIGRCSGPCAGHITTEAYMAMVNQVIDLLQGNSDAIARDLKKRMEEASAALQFEEAAELRDQLKMVERVVERQRADFASLEERDAFSISLYKGDAMVQVMNIRDGKMVNSQQFFIEDAQEAEADVLFSILKQYYVDSGYIPTEILVPFSHEELPLIEAWLTEKRGKRVHMHVPQRGEKKRLVELCTANAKQALVRREAQLKREWDRGEGALLELQNAIGLDVVPRRIECYDISHTQGAYTVASMVVYTDGKPDKSAYRRFRIKTVDGIDDFKSMREVISRRLLRAMESDEKSQQSFGALPDLIVIDGGKGQLSSALDAMGDVGFAIPMIGLAKRIEEIFLPGESEPILLKSNSPALHILQGIRDEAHRFAITYHRSLRANASLVSELDGIEGIGKKRKNALMVQYKTIEQIKAATLEELMEVPNLTKKSAEQVYRHFHDGQVKEPQAEAQQ
ncbi:excinuclease ABC subunit UvrC, partial [Eubacteriales bacterium OttesenSCG-928-M02]|nr:excinuclease ABC subunit UvrC [Eubacteriales bacterium OttesenSCG-928-M02]